MILKHFNTKIIVRVALIIVSILLFTRIMGNEDLFFNQLILATLFIIQLVELVWFLNHTNREVSRFLYAIRHDDFSIAFRNDLHGGSFDDLHKSFAFILDAYKQVKTEKEIQYQFLQKLVDQINIGIISIEGDTIGLINPFAEKLIGIPRVRNWKLVRQLNPEIANALDSIGDQGRKLIETGRDGETRIIAADITTLTILDKPRRLITLQDINSEIEQKEIEAWHKLIRILTHEIMNSITPVTSLTETMQGLLVNRNGDQKSLDEIKEETITDIRFSLNTIQKRSEGLLNFVESYRQLTRVPKPRPQRVVVKEFLDNIRRFFSVQLTQESIVLTVQVEPVDMTVMIDAMLMDQAMINLVTNSIHAVKNRREQRITLSAYHKDNGIMIEVSDTGMGIAEKELKEIFVPFFSTRKNGSGIGLSLTKQIVSLHGGRITVKSTPGYGTTFLLRLKHTPETPS